MTCHVEWGAELLRHLPDCEPIARIVRHHHERYDGARLPRRAGGDADPARQPDHRGLRRLRRDGLRPARTGAPCPTRARARGAARRRRRRSSTRPPWRRAAASPTKRVDAALALELNRRCSLREGVPFPPGSPGVRTVRGSDPRQAEAMKPVARVDRRRVMRAVARALRLLERRAARAAGRGGRPRRVRRDLRPLPPGRCTATACRSCATATTRRTRSRARCCTRCGRSRASDARHRAAAVALPDRPQRVDRRCCARRRSELAADARSCRGR